MRIDGRKDIPSIKSAWLVLHSLLKANVLSPLEENDKGVYRSLDSLDSREYTGIHKSILGKSLDKLWY